MTAARQPTTISTPSVTVATVTRADDPLAPVVTSERFGTLSARVAIAGEYRPAAGDRVLVTSDEHGNPYVVGVLRALREAEPRVAELEQRVEGGRTILRVPRGDLRLEAAEGRVELSGARGVVIDSGHDVSMTASGRVDVASRGEDGTEHSGLHLHGHAAELRAGLLTAKASHLHVLAERATLLARRADTHLERLRQRVDVIETRAEKIVEEAKDTYRTVEGLAQTHAGRIKLVAKTTLHTLAERAKLRAKKAFAIDGDKIYLG